MYTAPLLAVGLLGMLFYRALFKFYEKRSHGGKSSRSLLNADGTPASDASSFTESSLVGRALLLIFHYYTPLYVVLVFFVLEEMKGSYAILEQTDWLNPATLRAQFANETDLPPWWENELHYMLEEGGNGYLRKVSLVTPVFMVLTVLITLANTIRHVYTVHVKRGGINTHIGHDSAILIIALPLIYTLMSFKSVGRMWMIAGNVETGPLEGVVDFEGHHSWLARLVMNQLMYKTNFMVADVYEAIALFQFAWLTLEVIGAHRYHKGDSSELSESSQKGIESLTVQGIMLFILNCMLESIYYLFTTSVEVYLGEAALSFTMAVHAIKEQVHFFFLGAGFMASSAAIGNVVTVEITFHELLEEFYPSGKFWSTKILVSIAFLQSLILYVPPFNKMSTTEGNLLYASLLTIECCGVSLLHWTAWNPHESWYKTLVEYRAHKASLE